MRVDVVAVLRPGLMWRPGLNRGTETRTRRDGREAGRAVGAAGTGRAGCVRGSESSPEAGCGWSGLEVVEASCERVGRRVGDGAEVVAEEPVVGCANGGRHLSELAVGERCDGGVHVSHSAVVGGRDEPELFDPVQRAAHRGRLDADLTGQLGDAGTGGVVLVAQRRHATQHGDSGGAEDWCPAPLEVRVVEVEPEPGDSGVRVDRWADHESVVWVHDDLGRTDRNFTTLRPRQTAGPALATGLMWSRRCDQGR